jgi:pantoate--beta-alanine ligase
VTGLRVVNTIAEVREAHDATRRAGGRVGLVPTMGYLHAGRLP